MTILSPVPVSSARFDYKADVFTAEISDTKIKRFGRVYDDACDVGFTIISAKTGKEAVFALKKEHRDRDGDITHWDFICVTPGLRQLRAEIFND